MSRAGRANFRFLDRQTPTTKPKTVVVLLALVVVVFAALPVPARADDAVATDIDAPAPKLPFTSSELRDALALRGGDTDDVTVRALSPTLVEVSTPVGRVQVDVGTARGRQAARLVALQLAELGIEPPRAGACCGVVTPSSDPATTEDWISIVLGLGRGLDTADTTDTAFAMFRMGVTRGHGRWRLGGSVGWLHGGTKVSEAPDRLSLDLGIVRSAAGLALGRLTLLASPQLVWYRIGRSRSGLTPAIGAGLHFQIASSTSWKLTASTEADAFRYRITAPLLPSSEVVVARAGISWTATLGVAWRHL